MQKMARQFFEVFDFADFIHLVDDSIQDGLNLLVRLFLKERPLPFQPTFMAEKFLLIECGDVSFSCLRNFHEGRTITLCWSACKPLFKDLVHRLRIRSTPRCFHDLANKESEISGLALAILFNGLRVFFDYFRHDLLDFIDV
jgi:hypothetical protein